MHESFLTGKERIYSHMKIKCIMKKENICSLCVIQEEFAEVQSRNRKQKY